MSKLHHVAITPSFVLTLSFMLTLGAAAEARTVNCLPEADPASDPDWSRTLFCDWARTPPGPCFANPASCTYTPPDEDNTDGKQFSARMLYTYGGASWVPADDYRCVDGTEPAIHVDPGNSDNWLFFFGGGASCSRSVGGAGAGCDEQYVDDPAKRAKMTTHNLKSAQNHDGILRDTANNPMRDFNRVKFHKCSFDCFQGRGWLPGYLENNPSLSVTQSGFRIVRRALELLDTPGGMSYDDCSTNGGQCALISTMQQLCQVGVAQKFVFVGHSAGGHGLIQIIDGLSTLMGTFPGCNEQDDDVLAVIDAHFMPMTENECKYDAAGCDTCAVGQTESIYCSDYEGQSSVSFDADMFSENAFGEHSYRVQYADWGLGNIHTSTDSSCYWHHALTDGQLWKCADRFHVLANHVSTPFFLRESLADRASSHFDSGNGHPVKWADGNDYNVTTWDPADRPVMSSYAGYAARMLDGAGDMVTYGSDACEAPPWFAGFFPYCDDHEGAANNSLFNQGNMTVAGTSYKAALAAFLNDPAGEDGTIYDGRSAGPINVVPPQCE